MRRDRGDQFRIKFFHQVQNIIPLDERHLQVELGELRLAVPAQVLIPEAARDLEVAVHAGHHQQLFELLRRLRQGIKLPRIDPRGDKVVARALRCRFEKDRRLDLHEVPLIQEIPHVLDHLMAQDQVASHPLPTQVQIAIAQAHVLIRQVILGAHQEGQIFCRVQDFDRLCNDLHLSGLHLRILHAGRSLLHHACDL